MAIIGGSYCWVESESLDTPVEVASHPVETGLDITSFVRPAPATLTIKGEIVGEDYADTVRHLRNLARGGQVLEYIGKTVLQSAHIVSFTTRALPQIKGGVEFDMQLREVRIARKNYQYRVGYTDDLLIGQMNFDGTTSLENLSQPKQRYHTLMAGETLYFVAQQYRSRGVTVEELLRLNLGRDIFSPGHEGEAANITPGAKILLGVW